MSFSEFSLNNQKVNFGDDPSSSSDDVQDTAVQVGTHMDNASNLTRRKTATVGADADGANQDKVPLMMESDPDAKGSHGKSEWTDPTPVLCGDPCETPYLKCNHTTLDAGSSWWNMILFGLLVFLTGLSFFIIKIFINVLVPAASNRALYAGLHAMNLFMHMLSAGRMTGAYFNLAYSVGILLAFTFGKLFGFMPQKYASRVSLANEWWKAIPLLLGQIAAIVVAILLYSFILGPIPAGSTYGGLVLGSDDFTSAAPGPLSAQSIWLLTIFVAAIEFSAYLYSHSVNGLADFGLSAALVVSSARFVMYALFGPYTMGMTNPLFWLFTSIWRNVFIWTGAMVAGPFIGVAAVLLIFFLIAALFRWICKGDQCPNPNKPSD